MGRYFRGSMGEGEKTNVLSFMGVVIFEGAVNYFWNATVARLDLNLG